MARVAHGHLLEYVKRLRPVVTGICNPTMGMEPMPFHAVVVIGKGAIP